MKLETIKQAVNNKFNLDITLDTRQRNYTYAKKVFCKLAYESGSTFKLGRRKHLEGSKGPQHDSEWRLSSLVDGNDSEKIFS